MTFAEYLLSKKINEAAFKQHDPLRFEEWLRLFEQVHEASFTMQKKFLLNPVRRQYPLPRV